MKLHIRTVLVPEIDTQLKQDMYKLLGRYFCGVSYERFEVDLSKKDWVIILEYNSALQGFSTHSTFDLFVDSTPVKIVFSGDTIIDKKHWGTNALAVAWMKSVVPFIDSRDGYRLYWFLICKGYRTYRYLPIFFKKYLPQVGMHVSAFEKQVLDSAAIYLYPNEYDRKTGIIRLKKDVAALREGVGEVTEERLLNEYVEFFIQKNPGHEDGDELACLTEISWENVTPVFRRVYEGVHHV